MSQTHITSRASVFPFQTCLNSVSGFANSVFYPFKILQIPFFLFLIFKIPFHFFQAIFFVSMIFVKFIWGN